MVSVEVTAFGRALERKYILKSKENLSQIFTCSKITIETVEEGLNALMTLF